MTVWQRIADRWRWFRHREDIITRYTKWRLGSDLGPLSAKDQARARVLAQDTIRNQRAMTRKQRAYARREFMSEDWAGREQEPGSADRPERKKTRRYG